MVFYNSATTNEFLRLALGDVNNVIFSNDGANPISFSADGKALLGIVNGSEQIEFRDINFCQKLDLRNFYTKATIFNGFSSFRIWSW